MTNTNMKELTREQKNEIRRLMEKYQQNPSNGNSYFTQVIVIAESALNRMEEETEKRMKEKIVEEYGDYRLIKKFGLGLAKYGRTLRFYLSPHTKHKDGDDDYTF